MERLKKGVYGEIYNYPFNKYKDILDMEEVEGKEVEEEDEEVQKPNLSIYSVY